MHTSTDRIHDVICEVVGPLPPSPAEAPANEGPALALAAAAANARSTDQGGRDGMVHRRCLALRDYYPFWRQSLEEAGAGKLLPVDLSENPKVGWCWSPSQVLRELSTHWRDHLQIDHLHIDHLDSNLQL